MYARLGVAEPYYQYARPLQRNNWISKLPIVLVSVAVLLLINNFSPFGSKQVTRAFSNPSMPKPPQTDLVNDVAPLAKKELSDQTNKQLDAVFQSWVAKHPNQSWGLYVEDLKDSRIKASFNADKQFELASIYKLFLLASLEKKLPSSQWASTKIRQYTYGQCVTAMIQVSDNDCAVAIANILGWGKVDKYNHSLGYDHTFLNRSDFLSGTASDVAVLLKRLYNSEGYDATTQSMVMEAMRHQYYNQGIPKGCPGCTVFNKTGNEDGFLHDAAIVEDGNRAYELVIFSKGGSNGQFAELSSQIHQLLANH